MAGNSSSERNPASSSYADSSSPPSRKSSQRVVKIDTGVMDVPELAVVGKPIPRIDGPMKVSGLQRYGADLYLPGMLYVKTVRSPHPHAQVLAIDAGTAMELPGVKAVITADDIQGNNRHGLAGPHRPVLVEVGKDVHHVGDPVALVVAETIEQAETGAAAVKVRYELLPAVFDPEEALLPDAPRLQDDKDDNIVSTYELIKGDVEVALTEAAAVVEQTYHVPSQEHVQLESEAGLATIDPEGFITVYAAAQDPIYILRMINQALGVPQNKIRVKALPSGGSFGVKCHINVQVHLALAALVTKHPVKLVWSRKESVLAHPKRHPAVIHYKMGGQEDGKITVIDVEVLADSGGYPTSSPWVFNVLCGAIPGPYDIPNIRIIGKVVATNNPIKGTFRGYGDPQGFTPTEMIITQLSERLGMDPVTVRLKSGHTMDSKPSQHGVHIDHPVMLGETIKQAVEIAGPKPKPSGPKVKVGRGVSCVMPLFNTAGNPWGPMAGTGANVELLPDGNVVIRCGVCEIGVGITTVLAQVASEELGVPMESIEIIFGDSLASPKAGPSVASRQAYTSGNAVREACRILRTRMVEVAARHLEVRVEEIWPTWGKMVVENDPSRNISIPELAFSMYNTGIDREVRYWFRPSHAEYGHVYVTAIVDLEVDTETGQIEVLQVVNSHDIGKALNPLNVRGQLIGGGSQALGWVLMEDLQVEKGHILTPSLTEYLTPTSMDIPGAYKTVLVEAAYPTGPYGAKGVGEHGMDSTPAAVLNAIFDATGIEMNEWPVTPEKMWRALKEKEHKQEIQLSASESEA